MKKRTGLLVALLLSCVILPGLIYLGLAIYYQDSFYYGTWINGIYCTGKTIEEVQKEMTEGFSYSGLAVKGNLEEIFLSAKEIDLEFDFQPDRHRRRASSSAGRRNGDGFSGSQ